MQGKGKSLRLSLMALVVVLIFGALGGMTLARDAFDADYNDCPAVTRLDAVDGLTIDRTDEEDEIRISWDALDSADLSQLGPNGYRARLTIIVEGEDRKECGFRRHKSSCRWYRLHQSFDRFRGGDAEPNM